MATDPPHRILVTGGAGFIGSNFIHHLFHGWGGVPPEACCPDGPAYPRSERPDLHVLNLDKLTYAADLSHLRRIEDVDGYTFEQLDICDPQSVDDAVQAFEPEAIVHFAAESHVDRSIEDGAIFVRSNVLGTQILLDAARRHDVPRFLHISTDEVYGSIEEGSFTEEDSFDPSSPYSASKAGSDLLARAQHKTYGLDVVITRSANNYGPRQHPEKLVPKIITRALSDQPLPIYGDGSNVRDWLYVKDHCEALMAALTNGEAGEVYNISGGSEVPNLDLVKRMLGHLGKPESLIRFVEDRPGHDFRYSIDDSKLRGLEWSPRVTLDEGLKHTIEWYRRRAEVPTP